MRSSNLSNSSAVFLAPLARGKNPSKVNRSVGSPESAIAIVGALGPGTTFTSIFSAIASRINLKPGSLIVGIPASDTTKTFLPSRRSSKTSSVRAVSLPSKNEMTRPVKVTSISEQSLWNLLESSAAIISALSIALFKRRLASPGLPSGVAASVRAMALSSQFFHLITHTLISCR